MVPERKDGNSFIGLWTPDKAITVCDFVSILTLGFPDRKMQYSQFDKA